MTTPLFDKLALIGIGLIGSSLARVIRAQGLAARDRHCDAAAPRRSRAREELGLGDSYTTDSAEAVEDADLVIVSVPVGASGAVAAEIAARAEAWRHRHRRRLDQALGDRADAAASARRRAFHSRPSGRRHRKSGPDAGFAELFENRWCILTPLPGTDAEALSRGLPNSGARCGSNVERWTPSTTTWCSPSLATCRTSSPTTSSAPRTIWRRSPSPR